MGVEVRELTVPVGQAGLRLDVFVSRSLPGGFSRSYVQKLLTDGHVLVNGEKQKAGYRVREGDAVRVAMPPPEPARLVAEDIELPVLYEDHDILVIDKPRGMVVHPAPGHPRGTMVNALLARCPQLAGIGGVLRPGIVHRLDKDTTGIVVVAKNQEAHAALAGQLKARTMKREYLALVRGDPPRDRATVDAPLGRHPRRRVKIAVVAGGRPAVTHFEVLERFGDCALLRVCLDTGRTHQIRVHMAHLGHPVVGDRLYGGGRGIPGVGDIVGQALHAGLLGFRHPRTGEYLEFTTPPPPDMSALVAGLRRRGSGRS